MKITCGIDMIEIARVKKSIENTGEKFLQRIFTETEIAYCESRKSQKYQHYAARFAAKEAIFKALGSRLKRGEYWRDFEVVNVENGKPEVNLKIEVDGLESLDISISHCKEYAVANVVAGFKET